MDRAAFYKKGCDFMDSLKGTSLLFVDSSHVVKPMEGPEKKLDWRLNTLSKMLREEFIVGKIEIEKLGKMIQKDHSLLQHVKAIAKAAGHRISILEVSQLDGAYVFSLRGAFEREKNSEFKLILKDGEFSFAGVGENQSMSVRQIINGLEAQPFQPTGSILSSAQQQPIMTADHG